MLLYSCKTPDPVACFEVPGGIIEATTDIQFTSCSEHAFSFQWDFGDGTSSMEQNPTKSYDQAGAYTVTLTVFSEDGDKSDQQTMTVTVGQKYLQKITLKQIDFTRENGAAWDHDTTGPDVMIQYGVNGGNTYETTVLNDLPNNDLPHEWVVSPELPFTNEVWYFTIFDQDEFILEHMKTWSFNPFGTGESSVILLEEGDYELELAYEVK